ncbi:hypothetical protein Q4566_05150 [Tamlana sp. 2_MG-2023]|uniref:hypothetical protein n=1 Tax=unclassified Tamlana TaxID=2614803 RepID=UPI0026E301F3|nr:MULTISPECIES: hypothetical protein [unclassified Tamlana]MDO6759580.1 hypothetical protein [Tamlana sp. 2_MG-2023]MDO6792193.1 hypothetical protein [Tamlana sp. 1_MG-2023]
MTPKELASLEGEELANAFVAYFKPWALTPSCVEMLEEISTKIINVTYEDELKVYFENYDEDEASITFGAPYTDDFQDANLPVPESYMTVVKMHNTIMFGDGVPDAIDFYGYDGEGPSSEFMLEELEGDEEIHQGFCEAGQNWIIWDHQRKNALGEPVIIIADHGLAVEDNDDFPEQNKIAFGTGGLFIRLMKEFVFGDTDYGWG